VQIEIRLRLGGKLELRHHSIFIKAQVTGIGTDKTAREDPSGKFGEIFVFNRFEKTQTYLRRERDFIQTYTAHLSFTPKILTEC